MPMVRIAYLAVQLMHVLIWYIMCQRRIYCTLVNRNFLNVQTVDYDILIQY